MEEKKFDLNSLIGMLLLGALAFIFIYQNQPSPEELEQQKLTEQHVKDSIANLATTKVVPVKKEIVTAPVINLGDSIAVAIANSKKGTFDYAATLPSAKTNETTLKNDLLEIKVSNKGGQITSLKLNNFKTYDAKELYLIKDNNALLNLTFSTNDGRTLHTKDMYFEPVLSKDGENQVLEMRLKTDDNKYLAYRYVLKPNDYMLDFSVQSHGLSNVINTSEKINLDWNLKTQRTEKSVKYENQYTELDYMKDGDFDYLSSMSKDAEEEAEKVNWIGFKKQFFSAILASKTPFNKVKVSSKNLVEDHKIDTVFTKQFASVIELPVQNNEINANMQLYYGPTDYKILDKYKDYNFERLTIQGWAIVRVINKYFIMPMFNLLSSFIGNLGWVIIFLTIVVKLLMSPLLYKSFLSSAKMKVIKPELAELNEKYPGKDNAMKRQQETMALQRKAGVNPMAGCVPALLQMPIFFALFRFFPTNLDLRQKSFLWVNDLSAYDEIAKLPIDIPFYGSHVALFPILASISMFFYMKITQGQQADMQQPTQEGMPDMQGMMKMMLYISPLMMLFFFNSYGSGLSIYYFVSQLISIGIMLVIKNYIIDEKKIHAQIQVNKTKAPKKKSAFRQKIDDAMKQAQAQQEAQKKGGKKK
jgi:YidC/Oxa1 family membrane protein insertase